MRRVVSLIVFLCLLDSAFAITPQALADSMTAALGFPSCVAPVRVRSLQIRRGQAVVRCNRGPANRAFSADELAVFKRRVAEWTGCTSVRIYAEGTSLDDLVIRHRPARGLCREGRPATVALWASHGRYLSTEPVTGDPRWVWQRAKQWITVEDRLTTEYSTRVSDLLRDAGVQVLMPRPDPRSEEGQQTGESGLSRWMEGALYWLRSLHYPDTVTQYTHGESEYKDDLFCRPQWVNHLIEIDRRPVDMVLALHTDGYDQPGDSDMVGTLALYTGNEHRQMAHLVQRQLVLDMQRTVAPEWCERELRNCQYVETRLPKAPAMILEIASHKDISDARYLLDPRAMDIAARAIYKGVMRALYGYDTPITPLRPDSVRLTRDGVLSWTPVLDPLEPQAFPTSYLVTDQDGRTYRTSDTLLRMDILPEREYRFTVRAVNDGGVSRPTVPVAIYRGPDRWVQICNLFDSVSGPEFYFDSLTAGVIPGRWGIPDSVSYAMVGLQTEYRRAVPWVSDDDCGWGECSTQFDRVLVAGNTHDYHLRHADLWRQAGYSYIATYAVPADTSFARVDYIASPDGPIVLSAGEYVSTPWGDYALATEPCADRLYCNRAARIALVAGDVVLGRFSGGLPAIVLRDGHLVLAFRLESLYQYEELLKIWMYEEEKSSLFNRY